MSHLPRVGVKFSVGSRLSSDLGVAGAAAALEQAGWDSLWVSDHVVLPESTDSAYPFSADGQITWNLAAPVHEALIVLAQLAAGTRTLEIGTAVLVLPQRQPVLLAKQVATLDQLSQGRVVLGVGAGWVAEEFAALGVPFDDRGARTEDALALVRSCFTGRPAGRPSNDRYPLPEGMLVLPPPARAVPLLVGGMSKAALRRAARAGDGWLAQQSLLGLDLAELRAGVSAVRQGEGEGDKRFVLRLVDSLGRLDEVRAVLPALADVGMDDVVIDLPLEQPDQVREDRTRLLAQGSA